MRGDFFWDGSDGKIEEKREYIGGTEKSWRKALFVASLVSSYAM